MINTIRKNLGTLIILELLYGMLIFLVLIPGVKYLFDLGMKISGLSYLSEQNVGAFFGNPIVVLLLILVMFVVAVIALFEINGLNIIFMASKEGRRINILTTIKNSFVRIDKRLKLKNLLLYVYLSILLPFLGVVYNNPIIEKIRIPEFLMESIKISPWKLVALLGGIAVILVFSFFNVYTFLFLLRDRLTFFNAMGESVRMVKRGSIPLVITILKAAGISAVMWFAFAALNYGFYMLAGKINNWIIFIGVSTLLLAASTIIKFLFNVVIKVYVVYSIGELFVKEQGIIHTGDTVKRNIVVPRILKLLIICVMMVLFSLSVVGTAKQDNSFTTVMAHRGSSGKELENTEKAFRLAMKEGSQYIELDVVETKDNQVVVIHDRNLNRLAGVNKKVGELTLRDILKLGIAGKISIGQSKIMSLKDLLPIVDKHVVLNVELKPEGGNDVRLARSVEALLKKYPRHMVCSFSHEALKETKRINPERRTGLIMAIAVGDYMKLNYADFYSIEESFVTPKAVERIQSVGKGVFVWTVNDMTKVGKYVAMGVDGIITDYPLETSKAIYDETMNSESKKLLKLFTSW